MRTLEEFRDLVLNTLGRELGKNDIVTTSREHKDQFTVALGINKAGTHAEQRFRVTVEELEEHQ